MLMKQIHGAVNSHASVQTDHGQEGMRHPATQTELPPHWLLGKQYLKMKYWATSMLDIF